MDEKVAQIIHQTVNLIEGIIITQKNFKFDSHERVLAYLLDKLIDPKLSSKIEDIFFRYLEERKQEYFNLISFLVNKNSYFNPSTQNSHKLLQKKLLILLKLTQEMANYEYQNPPVAASPNPKSGRFSS
jgi:hypothetical protein